MPITLKKCAVWTYGATLKLLKLYEKKLEMLETPKKKTKIWIAISGGLKNYNIEMSPSQVRWKINALTKRYKQCIDTGRPAKFKYFRELDNIYSKYSSDCETFILGEFINIKKNIYRVHTTRTNIPQVNESKAMIELRKIRLANRIETDRLQSKLKLEKQWLEYLEQQEQINLIQDEVLERSFKIKEEELQLRRCELQIKESLETKKLQMREREQNDLIDIERMKCVMLQQVIANKIFYKYAMSIFRVSCKYFNQWTTLLSVHYMKRCMIHCVECKLI